MGFNFQRAFESQIEGKAIPYVPQLVDRTVPISTYTPGYGQRPREDAVISQEEAGRHMQGYGGREALDWLYDCIQLYVDPISTSPYFLQKPDGTRLVREKTKGTPPDYQVGPKALYNLLDEPNPFMAYDELLSLLVMDIMLVGNAYWFKYGSDPAKPLALYRMAPSHVKIVPGDFGPKAYKYQPPGVKNPVEFPPETVIHFRRPNPHSPHYGMGMIQGIGQSLDVELSLTNTMRSYYDNQATPSMIVQSDRRVPRDVFNRIRMQLRARAAGSRNAGELLVLESGLKASSLDTSAADALFETMGKMSRDRIYAHFRANQMLFGIMDGSAGSNKISDARREFDNSALQPFMVRLQRQITRALTAGWDAEFVVDYRYQSPPDEAVKNASLLAALPGIKVREVRRQLAQFGVEESTGDKTIDEEVLNKPGEEMDANGQGGTADRNLVGEAGRPPKGSNTKSIGVASPRKGLNSGAKGGPAHAEVFLETLERIDRLNKVFDPEDDSVTNAYGDVMALLEGKAVSTPAPDNRLPGEQRPDDVNARLRRDSIDFAQTAMMRELRDAAHELERDLLTVVEGKALKTSDIVARTKNSKAWGSFKDRVRGILAKYGQQVASNAVVQSGLTPDEDVDYDAIVEAIVSRPEGVNGIVRTLKTRIGKHVNDVRDNHGERGDYEAEIRSVISDWSENQVLAIADSEAVEVYNEATLTVAEQAGVENVYVTDGDDDDAPCQEANGSYWTIEQARKNRKEHPRCRRAFLPMPAVA